MTALNEATQEKHSLVDSNGAICFGRQDRLCAALNLHEFPLRPPLLPSGSLTKLWSKWRLKEWEHFFVSLPDALLSFAVIDVQYMKLAWCQVICRHTGEQFRYEIKKPWLNAALSNDLWDAHCYVRERGFELEIHNHLNAGEHRFSIALAPQGKAKALQADFVVHHDLHYNTPLEVALPLDRDASRAMFTHKVALPATGVLRIGEKEMRATRSDTVAVLDIHKAHYPYHTWWHWATAAGFDRRGRLVAFNLTRNVITDDQTYNENATWQNGRLHTLGPARFFYTPPAAGAPGTLGQWQIRTLDNRAALRFVPKGLRQEKLNAGVVKSGFEQYYGDYFGKIQTEAGGVVDVEGLSGLFEVHDSYW